MAKWFSARILLAGFILLLSTLLIILVVGNLARNQPEELADIVRQQSDLSLQKINYTETQDGHRKWSIQADSASHDFKEKKARIEHVRMVIYGQQGGDIVVTSRQGSFDLEKGVVRLTGDVTLENIDNQSVYAEDLEFYNNRKLLMSDGDVTVVSGDMQLSGTGMRYDLESRTFKLLSSVEASFVQEKVDRP